MMNLKIISLLVPEPRKLLVVDIESLSDDNVLALVTEKDTPLAFSSYSTAKSEDAMELMHNIIIAQARMELKSRAETEEKQVAFHNMMSLMGPVVQSIPTDKGNPMIMLGLSRNPISLPWEKGILVESKASELSSQWGHPVISYFGLKGAGYLADDEPVIGLDKKGQGSIQDTVDQIKRAIVSASRREPSAKVVVFNLTHFDVKTLKAPRRTTEKELALILDNPTLTERTRFYKEDQELLPEEIESLVSYYRKVKP
jgi:hypothetical protein